MKLSHATLLFGAALGVPAFLVDVGNMPVSVQFGWVAAIVLCGIAGVEQWAFEHAARTAEH